MERLLIVVFVSFCLNITITPAQSAIAIHPPKKEVPLRASWRPVTEAEYRGFLNDPDFALADKNLRLIWRDAQKALPLSRLTAIRAQQDEWLKTGLDRDAANQRGEATTRKERRDAYKYAVLERCQWLWNKFGAFKLGDYSDLGFGCSWVDYEKRVISISFFLEGENNFIGIIDANNCVSIRDEISNIIFRFTKDYVFIPNEPNRPIKLKFENGKGGAYFPGANYTLGRFYP